MPRKKTMPLEERLTELLALKGLMTLRSAMHHTGVIPPVAKGGALLCEHGAPAAGDGRCVECKREADRRLYRSRQYMKAITALVDKGIARPAGKGMWAYAGPPVKPVAKVWPRLPAEPVTIPPAAALTNAMQDIMGDLPHLAHGGAARYGRRPFAHAECGVCERAEAQARIDHEVAYDSAYYNCPPAETIRRDGYRQDGHEDCRICDGIETEHHAGRSDRLERYRRARAAGHTYAYMPDGRRILADGGLCNCDNCNARVAARAARNRRDDPFPATYGLPVSVYTVATSTALPRWEWRTIECQ